MVGYAFLRGVTRQSMSSRSEMLISLARSAAQSGLAHASEQILHDYNAASLDVLAGASGKQAVPAAPTHLDGPYRAPFVSRTRPNVLSGSTVVNAGYQFEPVDVGEENPLLETLTGKREGQDWHAQGHMIYDGRGRYIEVNYHNRTRPDPAALTFKPVVETDFQLASASAQERSCAVFMDENLRRLTTGTAEDQRAKARYRLRYAVGVEDLSGHLLTNPRAEMDLDYTKAANGYRAVPRWVDHAGHVLHNMMLTWNGSNAAALRLGHVFRGRGNSGNVDRSWRTTNADWIARLGLPASFPMMFRAVQQPANPVPSPYDSRKDYRYMWFGNHCYDNDSGQANLGGRLYGFDNVVEARLEDIPANPAGGEILTPVYQAARWPYSHALMGPQHSWWNQVFAVQGNVLPGDPDGSDQYFREMPNQDGGTNEPDWAAQWSIFNTQFTIFGRSLQASPSAPANWTWYQGRVDTPFHINLLTAPPRVISQMILAYLPPHLKMLHYTHAEHYKKIGEDADGHDIWGPEVLAKREYGPGGNGWDYPLTSFEILDDQIGPGWCEFPAPSSLHAGTTVIKPDYYQDPRDPRPIAQRYPGPLARGDTTAPGAVPAADQGADDLGRDIDVDAAMGQGMPIGQCTHTKNPLLFFSGSDRVSYYTNVTEFWKRIERIDVSKSTYKYSYFWDLAYALTTTLSYARATWVQYPNTVFEPNDASADRSFTPATLRDPLAYDTIEEIDALFLRQMGENPAMPGTPNPLNPIVAKRDSTWPWTDLMFFSVSSVPVKNTIRSLKTANLIPTAGGVSSDERAKVMERMLNDFRMSFFGSSPKYRDFRPLDFDGDGEVQCSCYDMNPAASHEEKLYRTNRWKAKEADGRGPAPSDLVEPFDAALLAAPYNYPAPDTSLGRSPWFTVTGCLFIGKSHFYRVFTRGEVYDNLLRKPVAQQDLEAVIAVDPEAPQFPAAGRTASEFRTIFKQWRYNDTISELPAQLR